METVKTTVDGDKEDEDEDRHRSNHNTCRVMFLLPL